MNSHQELLQDLAVERKRTRQKAVDGVIALLANGSMPVDELFPHFMGDNSDKTSSIIQIMCRSGPATSCLLLNWLREYRDKYNPIMDEHELDRVDNVGLRLIRSTRKYISAHIRFADLYEYLQELHLEAVGFRTTLLITLREQHPAALEDFRRGMGLGDWRILSDEELASAMHSEFEDKAYVISDLPASLRNSIVRKLQFYQFWLLLFRELSFDWIHENKEPLFSLDDVVSLQDNVVLDKICSGDSRFRDLVLGMIAMIPQTAYYINRQIGSTPPESLWSSIQENPAWYTSIAVQDFNFSPNTKALKALLVAGDVEALRLFEHICRYYYEHERQLPDFAIHIYQIFGLPEESEDPADNLDIQTGNRWEALCRDIAQDMYGEVLIHPELPNGFIPDIVVNENVTYKNGKLTHAALMIECKKSDKFIFREDPPQRGKEITEYNNHTTAKYLPYCERLEYWILEDLHYLELKPIPNRTVHVRTAADFLNNPSVSDKHKEDIRQLHHFYASSIEQIMIDYQSSDVHQALERISSMASEHLQRFRTEETHEPDKLEDARLTEHENDQTQPAPDLKQYVQAAVTVTKKTLLRTANGGDGMTYSAKEISAELKKELKTIQARIRELNDLVYAYEQSASALEDHLEDIQIAGSGVDSIPEEYEFTGMNQQVFKDLFFRKGMYEVKFEGMGSVRVYVKAKSTEESVGFSDNGSSIIEISKSRNHHVQVKTYQDDTFWKITIRLIER
ncbi:hypothetical protein [Paenibacillus sp. MBLB4367]|uniref:hypothetical protein n=1 Tax=Paenibacillus sp. MBLB4367 TaxID=3384767 RepID=UPI0039081380